VRDLDIAEVAQRSGVPASTLRFYEEKGLIASIGRRGLRRLFDPGVLERLALIALGRAAGFSLDEIARMFAPDGRPRARRCLSRADPHGVSHLLPHPAGRRVWSYWSAKEEGSAATVELAASVE
jgi:DNA-binding transcriptional MerR regulator